MHVFCSNDQILTELGPKGRPRVSEQTYSTVPVPYQLTYHLDCTRRSARCVLRMARVVVLRAANLDTLVMWAVKHHAMRNFRASQPQDGLRQASLSGPHSPEDGINMCG